MTTPGRKLALVLLTLTALVCLGAGAALAAGAIAFSEDQNYGYITANYPNARQAQQAALRGCKYPDCRVVMDFEGECASIAVGDEGYGWAAAPSKSQARLDAMTECSRLGRNCEELLSECDR
jgi:hypothetical protein